MQQSPQGYQMQRSTKIKRPQLTQMWTLLSFILSIISGILSESQLCNYQKSVELTNLTYNGVAYEENEYFVDNETGVERGCVCLKGVCARKCCPFGQIYDLVPRGCVNISRPFDPPVWEDNTLREGFNASKEFIFMFGKMECSDADNESRLPVYPAAREFRLRTDGKLYVDMPSNVPPVVIYEPHKYCIDTFVSDGQSPQLNAIICYVSVPENNHYGMSSSCMLISCFFMLLTVAVYACLPELRNLHGMVLMAYLLSFFVGFLFLASLQILILRKEITQDICIIFTFIVYFFLLSAFFWLNVMCYDIWWTFSGNRAYGRAGNSHKRFLYYSMYAFGVPTALTILIGALEFSGLQHALLPNLRLKGCFFYDNSKLLYLYGPIITLCVANMTFFMLTAFKIWKIKKETEMLRTKDSSTHDQERNDNQRFGLYVKLFTVMGINWILEVVSFFYPKADFFWQFSDAYNMLVGLIIFIIFVCKKTTYSMIKNRIKDFQRSNSNRGELKNVSSKTTNRWRTNAARLETTKTTVGVEADSKNGKTNDVVSL